MLLGASTDEDGSSIKEAFRLLRACAGSLRQAGKSSGAVLATVSRLDGSFGFLGLPAASHAVPTSGGLAGLVKTAGHEWPEVACKAIDLDPAVASPDEAASLLLREIFQRGPAEVGLGPDGTRTTLQLVARDLDSPNHTGQAELGLNRGDVVIITGGARGVTAEAAVALAEAVQPTIVLLGRSPEPVTEPEWLAPLADEAEIKRALVARANGHATPQLIGSQFRDLSANREILANLQRIEAAGSRVVYRSADVRDADALRTRLDEIRDEFGPIRALIHGAGCLPTVGSRIRATTSSRPSSTPRSPACEPCSKPRRPMTCACSPCSPPPPRAVRPDRANRLRRGQRDPQQVGLSARPETAPSCRVVAVNWGPWDGGMVTPSLRPLFESEGIPLIPLATEPATSSKRSRRRPTAPWRS